MMLTACISTWACRAASRRRLQALRAHDQPAACRRGEQAEHAADAAAGAPAASSSGLTRTLNAGVASEPSMRLTQLLAHLLRKNRGAQRARPPPGLSEPAVLRAAFVALLRLLRPALQGRHGPLAPFPAGALFLAVRPRCCRRTACVLQTSFEMGRTGEAGAAEGWRIGKSVCGAHMYSCQCLGRQCLGCACDSSSCTRPRGEAPAARAGHRRERAGPLRGRGAAGRRAGAPGQGAAAGRGRVQRHAAGRPGGRLYAGRAGRRPPGRAARAVHAAAPPAESGRASASRARRAVLVGQGAGGQGFGPNPGRRSHAPGQPRPRGVRSRGPVAPVAGGGVGRRQRARGPRPRPRAPPAEARGERARRAADRLCALGRSAGWAAQCGPGPGLPARRRRAACARRRRLAQRAVVATGALPQPAPQPGPGGLWRGKRVDRVACGSAGTAGAAGLWLCYGQLGAGAAVGQPGRLADAGRRHCQPAALVAGRGLAVAAGLARRHPARDGGRGRHAGGRKAAVLAVACRPRAARRPLAAAALGDCAGRAGGRRGRAAGRRWRVRV